MKGILHFLLALVFICYISCQKNEQDGEEQSPVLPVDSTGSITIDSITGLYVGLTHKQTLTGIISNLAASQDTTFPDTVTIFKTSDDSISIEWVNSIMYGSGRDNFRYDQTNIYRYSTPMNYTAIIDTITQYLMISQVADYFPCYQLNCDPYLVTGSRYIRDFVGKKL